MVRFDSCLSFSDVINAVLLLAAVTGLWLTRRQMKENGNTQRAMFFRDLYSTMFTDPDIRDAYYKIEYSEFSYRPEFHGSEDEAPIDRLLGFCDLVCHLHAQGFISRREMATFNYEFRRIWENPDIQQYLAFLGSFYARVGAEKEPFDSYVSYCRKEFHVAAVRGWARQRL